MGKFAEGATTVTTVVCDVGQALVKHVKDADDEVALAGLIAAKKWTVIGTLLDVSPDSVPRHFGVSRRGCSCRG